MQRARLLLFGAMKDWFREVDRGEFQKLGLHDGLSDVDVNGRVRRVGSWAALTRQPICYAYPTSGGTRDVLRRARKDLESLNRKLCV